MRQSKIVQNEWTPLPGRTRNLSPEHKVVVLLSRIFAHKKATPVQKFSAIPTKGKRESWKIFVQNIIKEAFGSWSGELEQPGANWDNHLGQKRQHLTGPDRMGRFSGAAVAERLERVARNRKRFRAA